MWGPIKLAVGMWRLRRSTDKAAAVQAIARDYVPRSRYQAMADAYAAQPGGAEKLATRVRAKRRSIEDYQACPVGSWGHTCYLHLTGAGIDPLGSPLAAVDDDISWVMAWSFEHHDMLHAITGFGVSREDELGLQVFSLAQAPAPGAMAVVLTILIGCWTDGMGQRVALFDALVRGWTLGRFARPLMTWDFDEWLTLPLEDARARAGILPGGVRGVALPAAG